MAGKVFSQLDVVVAQQDVAAGRSSTDVQAQRDDALLPTETAVSDGLDKTLESLLPPETLHHLLMLLTSGTPLIIMADEGVHNPLDTIVLDDGKVVFIDDDRSTDEGTPMTIFVKNLFSKSVPVQTTTRAVIRDVLANFQEQEQSHLGATGLTFQGKQLDMNRRLDYYNVGPGSNIFSTFKLCGGAPKPKVIKTIVKSKTSSKTLSEDRTQYETAYTTAVATHNMTSFSLVQMLEGMTDELVAELMHFLEHDHTKKDLKLMRVAEFAKPHRDMTIVTEKLVAAADHLRDLLTEDLHQNYSDEFGTIQFRAVWEKVLTMSAVKKDRATRMTD